MMIDKWREPVLLLDELKVRGNIEKMVARARRWNLLFRPHFKTHQSHVIGRWFRDEGVEKITVSSLKMARYFMEDGWSDITVAFPVNIREWELINHLAERIQLNLLVEAKESVLMLGDKLQHGCGVFIKIDTGYHRTGINPRSRRIIDQILHEIEQTPRLRFMGFLTHAGHTYYAHTPEEIKEIHHQSVGFMRELKRDYQLDYPELVISIGDTPSLFVRIFPELMRSGLEISSSMTSSNGD